jgi:hypothetical protein
LLKSFNDSAHREEQRRFLHFSQSFLRAAVALGNVNPKLKSKVEEQYFKGWMAETANRTLLKSKYEKLATNPGELKRSPSNHRPGHYFIGRDNTTNSKPSISGNFKFTVERAWLHPRVFSPLSHLTAPAKRPPRGPKLLDAPMINPTPASLREGF